MADQPNQNHLRLSLPPQTTHTVDVKAEAQAERSQATVQAKEPAAETINRVVIHRCLRESERTFVAKCDAKLKNKT